MQPVSGRGQILAGIACMVAISSPQYVWTLFTPSLGRALGAGAPALQVTFSLLVLVQALVSPAQGGLERALSPRLLIGLGIVLCGLSWILAARSTSLPMLWLTYGVGGGLGTGMVYVAVVSLLMRWLPRHRGAAAGLAASGYGMGAMLTSLPVSWLLEARGWRDTMTVFGVLIVLAGLLATLFVRPPPALSGRVSPPAPVGAVLGTAVFWLMFAMMTIMATSGLMVTSQMAQIARDVGVAHASLFGLAVLPLALTLDRLANGLTRPLFGALSDRLGRERTMALAFGAEGLAMLGWIALAHHPVLFVLMSGLVFLGWGEIFSLFPATLTDLFGAEDAARNYGMLYLAYGVGGILGGPLAAWLHQSVGSWSPVFGLAAGGDLLTAVLAIAVLRPLSARRRRAGAALA